MQKVDHLLAAHKTLPGTKYTIDHEPGKVVVGFPNQRKQRVYIHRDNDRYILTSTVLGARQLSKYTKSKRRLVELLWLRNQDTEVVTFTVDNKDRLIGRIDQVAETMDPDEIFFYVARLAQECDRLEYLLTGDDRS